MGAKRPCGSMASGSVVYESNLDECGVCVAEPFDDGWFVRAFESIRILSTGSCATLFF